MKYEQLYADDKHTHFYHILLILTETYQLLVLIYAE